MSNLDSYWQLPEHEILNSLDWDLNTFYGDEDRGKLTIGPSFGQGYTLYSIESFVHDVLSSSEAGFVVNKIRPRKWVFSELCLSKHFYRMADYLSIENPHLLYSEYVEVFLKSCREVGAQTHNFYRPEEIISEGVCSADLFNKLLDEIREKARSPEVRRRRSSRISHANRVAKSNIQYVDALFGKYSRLLVLRVDFSYKKEHTGNVGLNDIKKDMERLFNNTRSNSIFSAKVGSIWKIEYGHKKGYHFHAIFFFDGAKVRSDAYLANRIGNYWQEVITEGKGWHYNCNRHKGKYMQCGIGMVSHSDSRMIEALYKAVIYLAKAEQYVMVKEARNQRVRGRGVMPKTRSSSRGRPRR